MDIQETLDLEEWVNTLHDNSSLEDALYNATVYGGQLWRRGGGEDLVGALPADSILDRAARSTLGPPLVPDPARSSILCGHLGLSQHGHPVQAPPRPHGTWKAAQRIHQERVLLRRKPSLAGVQHASGEEGWDITGHHAGAARRAQPLYKHRVVWGRAT